MTGRESLIEARDRERNNAVLRSLPDVCACGHGRMEHYDGHLFCTWQIAEGDAHCDCEQYQPKEAK